MEILTTFTAPQLFSLAAGILLVGFSIIGWVQLILHGAGESLVEQEQLEKEQADYYKRYKVKGPR